MTFQSVEVAVIGGSGFYEFLDDPVEMEIATACGPTSGPITVGEIAGRRVAFLPRHGRSHRYPPHRVNYRGNLLALRELGVSRIFGPCAVGSLRAELHPGDFVALDQLVDRTSGRADTFLDGPLVEHVSFADPYCPELRQTLIQAGGSTLRSSGTVVVIQGPRFATRAESAEFRRQGWDVINMTQYPEAYLARELGMCYAGLALVTDYDTGVESDPTLAAVTMEAVLAVLAANVTRANQVLKEAIGLVPRKAACSCGSSGAVQLRRDETSSALRSDL